MTDNQIIKGLERTASWECDVCTFRGEMCDGEQCEKVVAENALDLINRQKAEIERLQKEANTPFAEITFDENKLQEIVDEYVKNIEIDINLAKSEAIKDFAERFMREAGSRLNGFKYEYIIRDDIFDNIVKEMTEVETNQRKEDEGK